MVKKPPVKAGDTGLIPGLGRSHMPQDNQGHVPQLLSRCSRAREPQLLGPHTAASEVCMPKGRAPQQEKPLQWEACAPLLESSPRLPQLKKALRKH